MKLIDNMMGLEAIAFQSPEFANKLTRLVEEILQERSGKAADESQAGKDLNKAIRTATGVNVDIIFNTEYPPCTMPFHINPDTILGHKSVKDFYLEDSKATMERLKKVKQTSYIDLKNNKVTGIFSEIKVPIYMGYMELRGAKLSAREIVAVLAHELGHCFVAYELAFRTARTNQILSSIAKAHAGGDKDQYKYVLKTTEEVLDLKTGVLDDVIDTKSAQTAAVVTLGHINSETKNKSVTGNATYDITTFEALADNYAVRLGLGKELATGLEKIMKAYGAAEYSVGTRILMTVIDIQSSATIIMLSSAVVAGNPLALPIIGMVMFIQYLRLDGREHNNVYDKLTTRYKRIKEQIVSYLKDNKLPPVEVKRALSSIDHIEKMIGEVSEYKGFLPIIFNAVDPASRAVNNAKDVQQKLETAAANDLYVKAAQFRTL